MNRHADDMPIARWTMLHPYVVAVTTVSKPARPGPDTAPRRRDRRRLSRRLWAAGALLFRRSG
jgi:hypothetical protein